MNDGSGAVQAADFAAKYSLNGFYYGTPLLGPALIQGDLSAGSFVFDGSGESMQVPDIAQLRLTGDLTIEAWVVPLSSGLTGAIASKGNTTTAAPYYLGLATGIPTLILGNGTTAATLTASTTLPVGTPSHVVARSFRGATAIFIDGISVATGSLGAQAVTDAGNPLYVGNSQIASRHLDAAIGEAALYSGALSSMAIARHFALGQQVISDPAHYQSVDLPVFS